MASWSDLRIHFDVLWIFRRKARRIGAHYYPTELAKDSFSTFWFSDSPRRVFGEKIEGSMQTGMNNTDGKLERIGKLLAEGMRDSPIAQALGVDTDTVAKVRRAIVERGMQLNCKCGKPSGHQDGCQHPKCIIDGCDKDEDSKGLCTYHYHKDYKQKKRERRLAAKNMETMQC